ncbi:MAG: dihydrofolate reductase [Patiriisocius sp.]|jgi:dihydrofolate reductase
MEIVIIAAVAKNRVIGKDNDLIWHLPRDMKFFTEQTTGYPVVMGRKNYFSIPSKYRPLPKRLNVVLTRKRDLHIDDVLIYHELEDAIEGLRERGEEKIFIIGGGQIYKRALELDICTKLLITHIDESFDGDAFFPEFDASKWKQKTILDFTNDERNMHDFRVLEYSK